MHNCQYHSLISLVSIAEDRAQRMVLRNCASGLHRNLEYLYNTQRGFACSRCITYMYIYHPKLTLYICIPSIHQGPLGFEQSAGFPTSWVGCYPILVVNRRIPVGRAQYMSPTPKLLKGAYVGDLSWGVSLDY